MILSSFVITFPAEALAAVKTPTSTPTPKSPAEGEAVGMPKVTPTPTVNLQSVSTANVLHNRLSAASTRLELIFNRITIRLQKMNVLTTQGKTSKIKQLNNQYTSLKSQIDKLKAEDTKIGEAYQTFLASPNNNNYQTVRKQTVSIDSLLKQILEGEKGVVKAAKQITPVASVSAVTVTPTPKK